MSYVVGNASPVDFDACEVVCDDDDDDEDPAESAVIAVNNVATAVDASGFSFTVSNISFGTVLFAVCSASKANPLASPTTTSCIA